MAHKVRAIRRRRRRDQLGARLVLVPQPQIAHQLRCGRRSRLASPLAGLDLALAMPEPLPATHLFLALAVEEDAGLGHDLVGRPPGQVLSIKPLLEGVTGLRA
jgi:hypothetical protein